MNILKEHENRTLQLPDGRQLGFAEYGNSSGKPIILFHGNPSSRLLYGAIPGFPYRDDLHLVVPDRPGYGLSDFYRRGGGLVDYPADIVALADALGLDKFAVFGASGGGPSALACAWKIPDRLTAVGLWGAYGPLTDTSQVGIDPGLLKLYRLAAEAPWVVRLQMAIVSFMARHLPRVYLKLVTKEMNETDKAIYIRLGLRDRLEPTRKEAFRQGGRASAYDITVAARWPIPLEEISVPVTLWQGEADRAVGGIGRHFADHLPQCTSHFIPDAGHFWMFEHLQEILEDMLSIPPR